MRTPTPLKSFTTRSRAAYIFEPINVEDHAGSYNPTPVVFPIRVGALRDITAVYFVASLMLHKARQMDTPCGGDDDHSKVSTRRNTPETHRISLPLLTILKQKVAALVPIMYDSLKQWKNYHFKMVYWDLSSFDELLDSDWLDKIVWLPDGSISYGQTAEKMMRYGKIIAIKKYRLACTYCFEDRVESLASKLGNKRLERDLEQNSGLNPLLNYWHAVLYGKPQNTLDQEYILESVIKDGNFYAVQYLLDNLAGINGMHKQNIISDSFNPLYTWRVLIDLNASEFDVVIKADGLRILRCFANKPQFEEMALTVWRYMLDRNVDDEKLVRCLSSIRENLYFKDVEHEIRLKHQMQSLYLYSQSTKIRQWW